MVARIEQIAEVLLPVRSFNRAHIIMIAEFIREHDYDLCGADLTATFKSESHGLDSLEHLLVKHSSGLAGFKPHIEVSHVDGWHK